MKRTTIAASIASLLLALALTPAGALAESLTGSSNWNVTYTTGGTMQDNYSAKEYSDQVSSLEPGDDITFTVTLKHENSLAADWYLANDVIESLEDADADATGSSYEYLLEYHGPNQSRTLYDSNVVGGTDSDGLNEATNALEDFIYLDNLSQGQTGSVTLRVALDGETEGNAYFDTLAKLKLRFAVEPPVEASKKRTTTTRNVVNTGEQQRLFPFYVAMVVSGVAFLVLAVLGMRERRAEREEGMR
ncbi:MAG: hypothetical protein IJ092_01170 [Atopobiaceae bacterium]|nr:hypothetical protein [Atopobiaceae bacterium]